MNLLLETKTDNYPFSHFTCSKVFDESFYKDLLANIPDISHFKPLKHVDAKTDNDSTRYSLILNESSLAGLQNKLLSNLYKYLVSNELKYRIYELLEKDLSAEYKVKLKKMPGIPSPIFYYDKVNYEIKPHTDVHKVVTTQFYLPHNEEIAHAGTCFLNNKYEIIKKLKFLPNTGYGFAVSKKSWHMVEKLEEISYPRISLMLIYYTEHGFDKVNKASSIYI